MTIIHTLWFEYGTYDKPNVLDLFTTFMAYLLEIESFLFCQWLKSVKIMLKRLRPSFLICSKFSILDSSQNVGEAVEAQTICWYTPFCWWFLHILLAFWLGFAWVSAIHFGQKTEGLSSRKRNWTRLLFPEHGARCVACDSTSCQVHGKVFEGIEQ